MSSTNHKPKRNILVRFSTTTGKTIIIIVVILICIRILMPYVVLHYANRTLATEMTGYYGHVEDIDIALIRGAYQLKNLYINKLDSNSNHQTPFFHTDLIDLAIEWKALFHGRINGQIDFRNPWLRFTKEKTDFSKVKKDTSDFRAVLNKFMPLDINKFQVRDGMIEYLEPGSKPPVDLVMTNTNVLALNLKNSYKSGETLPATVKASAGLYEGTLDLNLKINPLTDRPTFLLDAELKNTNLTRFNDFFKAYGSFDVQQGRFGIYSEMAAENGRFKGYVKPVIKDLKVLGPKDRSKTVLQQLWEVIVGAAAMVLKNQHENQIATKIPMEGDFNNPKTDLLESILKVLSNAFVSALMPSINNEINLQSVTEPEKKKNIFQRVKEGLAPEKKK